MPRKFPIYLAFEDYPVAGLIVLSEDEHISVFDGGRCRYKGFKSWRFLAFGKEISAAEAALRFGSLV
jgi:hypothetical protein